MAQSKRKPDCEHFRGMATNEDVCKFYAPESRFTPDFCMAKSATSLDCPTNGLRFKQRADSDDDGEVE